MSDVKKLSLNGKIPRIISKLLENFSVYLVDYEASILSFNDVAKLVDSIFPRLVLGDDKEGQTKPDVANITEKKRKHVFIVITGSSNLRKWLKSVSPPRGKEHWKL